MTAARDRLVVPPGLRFACRGCGLCCRRGWAIGVAAEERTRLDAVDWPARYPALAGRRLLARAGSAWRLAVDDAGACRFLDADNRCPVHAELGLAGKALACRLYPLYFVHAGGEVRVGAHFSCPAVADGDGPPVDAADPELRALLALVERLHPPPPPEADASFLPGARIGWDALAAFEETLVAMLGQADLPLIRRIVMASRFVDGMAVRFAEDAEPGEFELLRERTAAKAEEDAHHCGLGPEQLGPMERMVFRLLAGLASEMAVAGVLSDRLSVRARARLRRIGLAARFCLGRGRAPLGEPEVPLGKRLVSRGHPLPPSAEQLLARYLQTRFAARAYFGREGWGLPAAQGARMTLALWGIAVWIARHLADARGADAVGDTDVRDAVLLVDHTFGHLAAIDNVVSRRLLIAINGPDWPRRVALYAALTA